MLLQHPFHELLLLVSQFLNNQTPAEFIDSVKQKLLIDRQVLVDVKYRNLANKISFQNAKDTIYLSKMKIKSASGGIPIVYEYNVMKNDIIFYEFENNSRHKIRCTYCSVAYTDKDLKENYFVRKYRCPCCKKVLKTFRSKQHSKSRV